MLQQVPGFDGVPRRHARRGRDPRTAPANHSTKVYFEEEAMVQGIALYSAIALRHLAWREHGRRRDGAHRAGPRTPRGDPGARLLAGAVRPALRSDAGRPGRRRHQGGAAGGRHDPVLVPPGELHRHVLHPAELRQAEHLARPEAAAGRRAAPAAGGDQRRRARELPPRRDGPHGSGLRGRWRPGTRASSTPRSRATGRPGRGGIGGPTRRSSGPRAASPGCRAWPAAATSPTTPSPTATSTPPWSASPPSSPRCTSGSARASGSTSTSR